MSSLYQYACGIKAEVVGKPSPEFFKSALQAIGVEAHQAIMIGDDIVGDVGGAQQCGMRALQVRTGKFRSVPTAASFIPALLCTLPEQLPSCFVLFPNKGAFLSKQTVCGHSQLCL